MRDIEKYQKIYLQDAEDFERYQVFYRRKKILELYAEYRARRVVEIGCGMEPLFAFVPAESFERWVVVEPADAFYQAACDTAKGDERICCLHMFFGNDNDSVEQCRVQSGGANDLVICTGLLHELEHPDQVLKAIHSLCTPMTHVIFNVPNADSLHRVLGMWSGYIENVHELTERNQELQQHSVYDRGSFAKLLEESGFMVEKTGTFFIKPFTHRQMAACLKYGILNQRILDGLYRLSEDLPDFGSELYAVCRLVDGRG